MMKSPVIKRSIAIKGRQTSVSLEDAFWHDLKLMAAAEKTLSALISSVNDCRQRGNLCRHCGCLSLRNIKPWLCAPVRILSRETPGTGNVVLPRVRTHNQ